MSQTPSRTTRGVALALVAAAALLFAQCGKSTPTSPSPTPASPTVSSVALSVNTAALFKKGATAQITATGTLSTGATQDVTSSCASWLSANTSVATISGSGLVTAVGSGSATFTATCSSVVARLLTTLTVALKATPSVTLSSMSMGISLYTPYQPQVIFKVIYAETGKAFGYNVNYVNFTVKSSSGSTLSAPNWGPDMFVSGSPAGWKAGDPYIWPAWGTSHIDAAGTKYACFVSDSFTPMPGSVTLTWATQITDEVGTVVNYGSTGTLTQNPAAYSCDETHGISPNAFVFPMPALSGR